MLLLFATTDKPTTSSSIKRITKNNEINKEDMFKLIRIIETCKPLWDHRLPLGDRSENIKNNMWNEVFV